MREVRILPVSLRGLVFCLFARLGSVCVCSRLHILESLQLKLLLLFFAGLLCFDEFDCLFVGLGLFRLRHPLHLLLL
jgi:hypothetical protein